MNGDKNALSFKGKLNSGKACYLRHVGSNIFCSINDGSKEFNGQASFFVTEPLAPGKGYTFESVDQPDLVLSHDKNW